jgi:transcriptional regulator with XRE-family HTH domain
VAANTGSGATAAASFGQRLREARNAQGRTLREIALNAKVSIAYLSDLERGALSNPTLDKLSAIANELQVSVDELLGSAGAQTQTAVRAPAPTRTAALAALGRSASFREALREQAAEWGMEPARLAEEWLDALARIEVAGRRPRTMSDYAFVFEAARRAID